MSADEAARLEALEQQVAELQAQLEARPAPPDEPAPERALDRAARRDELRERLRERREARLDREAPSTLREALASPDELMRMGRALLHRNEAGDFDGYRLSAIRRGSVGDLLGLENGDVVHAVNGHALDSMEAALAAYNAVRDEPTLVLSLTRDGAPLELSLELDAPLPDPTR